MSATLNSNALVTLDAAKGYFGIPLVEVSYDSLVRDFINEASSLIENYCNRMFREKTVTELYSGGRTHELILKQWPVTSIGSIYIDSTRVFGTTTLVDSSKYTLGENERGEGYLVDYYDTVFPQGRKNVQIEYTYGYTDFTDVPSDLQLACKRTAAYYWKQQQNRDFTEIEKSKGNEDITLIDGLPLAASQILENYKRLEMLAPPDPVRNL